MDDAAAAPAPPEGFELVNGRVPFMIHNGPVYQRVEGERVQRAFFADERHSNGLKLVHGGMLSAFLDGVLAAAVLRSTERRLVTMHLSIDYLNMARVGEWLVGEAWTTRVTPEVGFAEGRVFVGDRDVIRGAGIFKLMRRRAPRT